MTPPFDKCEICARKIQNGVRVKVEIESNRVQYECAQCGHYGLILSETVFPSGGDNPDFRAALSCATRQASDAGMPLRINRSNAAELAAPHTYTRVSDNIERLLRRIAQQAGRPTRSVSLAPDTDFTVIDCFTKQEFNWYIDWITKQQLVSREGNGPVLEFKLTVQGWEKLQPITKNGGTPGRCFVAMWFDPTMNEIFELGIARAVTDCGLPKPIRIDRKEHNNQITDEIMSDIRAAEFVVADFTGNRGGVYYEAGFARGLGRAVIHCCRESDLKNLHFDTKIINHINWYDAVDLRHKLANRIKATIIPKG